MHVHQRKVFNMSKISIIFLLGLSSIDLFAGSLSYSLKRGETDFQLNMEYDFRDPQMIEYASFGGSYFGNFFSSRTSSKKGGFNKSRARFEEMKMISEDLLNNVRLSNSVEGISADKLTF